MGLGLLLMGPSCLFGELAFETNEISMTLPPDKDRLSVEFPFKVKGAKPVTIKEYQAACSCLSAEISGNGKLTWRPGESGVVRGRGCYWYGAARRRRREKAKAKLGQD